MFLLFLFLLGDVLKEVQREIFVWGVCEEVCWRAWSTGQHTAAAGEVCLDSSEIVWDV